MFNTKHINCFSNNKTDLSKFCYKLKKILYDYFINVFISFLLKIWYKTYRGGLLSGKKWFYIKVEQWTLGGPWNGIYVNTFSAIPPAKKTCAYVP